MREESGEWEIVWDVCGVGKKKKRFKNEKWTYIYTHRRPGGWKIDNRSICFKA